MRNRVVWLAVFLLIGFIGINSSHAQDQTGNFIPNGGFEDGVLSPWNIYGGATSQVVQELVDAAIPEDPIEGDYCLYVNVAAGAANFWNTGLQPSGEVFEQGKKYTISAFMKSKSGTLQINMKAELAADPWTAYAEQMMTVTEEWAEYSVTTTVFTENIGNPGFTFHIGSAIGGFWVDAVRFYEGDYVPPAFKPRVAAESPSPEDGDDNVPRDVVLSWEAGPFANTHDVYFGTIFDDVNDATTSTASQTSTTYDPEGLLEFGKTYYWRIDEVNAPPDSTVYKGAVWSFIVETYALPITSITATASSSALNQGPGNTVNGSGLDPINDQHSTIGTDMWLSDAAGPQPSWIQYKFGKAYALLEMWVWNSNQIIESSIGLGARDVTIEHSQDGEAWTTLRDEEFNQATSLPNYTHNTTVDLEGVFAQYVRLTVNSNWKTILAQYGLSEVRFFHVPVQASDPQPASGASDVALDVVLDWRAGREAALHEVYFSSDEQAVIDGTALLATVSGTSYQVGPLDYGQVYYWKINEVNDAAATTSWEGDVWDFSTTEFMALEDFESYSAENPIWESWFDGLGYGAAGTPGYNPGNGTGAAVGDENTPSFTEETIVHGGNQSMPLAFDNNKQGYSNYSETQHTFEAARNWTDGGITQLSLWFRGHPGSVGSFVENPAGTYTMTAAGADIWAVNGVEADEFHFAYKMLNGAGWIAAKVDSLQNTNDWAKAGVMIRETLDPDSAHAMAAVTPTQGVSFQRRPATSGVSTSDNSATLAEVAPHWVKLERSISGLFTMSHSTNGTAWQALGTPLNIQMSANIYVGLALTSHDVGLTCEAVFSNVTTSASVSGQWAHQDIGIASNDSEPVYVALADSSGALGVVAHEDPGATQISTWTEWLIDLTEFSDQGVNLADIKKMMLGVGNPTAPVAGGSGKMYFDDIAVGNPVQQSGPSNLLTNGGFETGELLPWIGGGAAGSVMTVVDTLVGTEIPEDPIEGDYCLHIVVEEKGANTYDSQLKYTGLVFEQGKQYTLSAFIKSDDEMQVRLNPQLSQSPYTSYGAQTFTVTNEWQEYSITTPVMTETVTPAGLDFHFNFGVGELWVDGVRFYEGPYVQPDGSPPVKTGNIVKHGGFEDGAATPLNTWEPLTWSYYGDASMQVVSEDAIEGDYCLEVNVPAATANIWDIAIQQSGHVLDANKLYSLSVWFKSKSGPLDIRMVMQRDGAPYDGYSQTVTITDEWTEYTITSDVISETISPAVVVFQIGYAAGEFLIDGIRFYEGGYVPAD